jgi:hypothetical protein
MSVVDELFRNVRPYGMLVYDCYTHSGTLEIDIRSTFDSTLTPFCRGNLCCRVAALFMVEQMARILQRKFSIEFMLESIESNLAFSLETVQNDSDSCSNRAF